MNSFSEDGLSFTYPENWQLEREESDTGWTVTVLSPGSSFLLVRMDRSLPAVEDVLLTTLEALREDYPTLEAESVIETLAGEMAMGHDIHFFSLDMVVTCWTRSFYGYAGTVLILCQVSGADDKNYDLVMKAICASMRQEEVETEEYDDV